MPVIACPQCPTQLKIPAGVSGNTKCPKCGTVFPVKTAPAFEVVDEPAPTPPVPPPPVPAPPPKKQAEEPDFEIVDDDPRKRVTAQPPKTLVYEDDEDEDDRPKKKPKKKKKPRYEDDEDEYWQPRPASRGALGKAETGAFLISISFWLNLATFGLLTLYAMVMWIGFFAFARSASRRSGGVGSGSEDFQAIMGLIIILPGLVGLCAWIVGLVGGAIAITGPARSRGMAIAATLIAGIHLLLVGVVFIVLLDAMNSATMRELGVGSPAWFAVATTLPVLDIFFPTVFTRPSVINVGFLLAFLTSCFEVARLVFMQLTVKGLARAAGDHAAAEKTQFGLVLTVIIIVVVALASLMMYLLLEGGGLNFKVALNLIMAVIFLTFLAYTFMMLVPAMAAHQTKNACGSRG